MTAVHADRPATEVAGRDQGVRATTPETTSSYPTSPDTSWRQWAEVEVTINTDIPAARCDYCGDLDSVTTVRVHQPQFADDVCADCAREVVQYAIDRHDDRHITQVEATS